MGGATVETSGDDEEKKLHSQKFKEFFKKGKGDEPAGSKGRDKQLHQEEFNKLYDKVRFGDEEKIIKRIRRNPGSLHVRTSPEEEQLQGAIRSIPYKEDSGRVIIMAAQLCQLSPKAFDTLYGICLESGDDSHGVHWRPGSHLVEDIKNFHYLAMKLIDAGADPENACSFDRGSIRNMRYLTGYMRKSEGEGEDITKIVDSLKKLHAEGLDPNLSYFVTSIDTEKPRSEKQLLRKIKGEVYNKDVVLNTLRQLPDKDRIPVMKMSVELCQWSPESLARIYDFCSQSPPDIESIKNFHNNTKKLIYAGVWAEDACRYTAVHTTPETDQLLKTIEILGGFKKIAEYDKDTFKKEGDMLEAISNLGSERAKRLMNLTNGKLDSPSINSIAGEIYRCKNLLIDDATVAYKLTRLYLYDYKLKDYKMKDETAAHIVSNDENFIRGAAQAIGEMRKRETESLKVKHEFPNPFKGRTAEDVGTGLFFGAWTGGIGAVVGAFMSNYEIPFPNVTLAVAFGVVGGVVGFFLGLYESEAGGAEGND